MANTYNKIIYGGKTLIDLTGDTITAADLATGDVTQLTLGSAYIPASTFVTKPYNVAGSDFRVMIGTTGAVHYCNYTGTAVSAAHNFGWCATYISAS